MFKNGKKYLYIYLFYKKDHYLIRIVNFSHSFEIKDDKRYLNLKNIWVKSNEMIKSFS